MDRFLGMMLWGLWRAMGYLPLWLLHAIGAATGKVSGYLAPQLQRRIADNLCQAGLAEQVSPKVVLAETGKAVFELAAIWFRPQLARQVEIHGIEHVHAARRAGKGILFLTPHLGCFEITARRMSLEVPITVLYRPPRKAWLRPLAEGARAQRAQGVAVRLASADLSGVRKLARALQAGEAVGLLPDQVPSRGEGVWAPFFNKPAYTMTLPMRLQERTQAKILLAIGERLPDSRGFVLHVVPFPSELGGDLLAQTTQINAALEMLIRRFPAQYLWSYNRYKIPAGVAAPNAAPPK